MGREIKDKSLTAKLFFIKYKEQFILMGFILIIIKK